MTTRLVPFEAVDPAGPVLIQVQLSWEPDDPFAVRLLFLTRQRREWVVARDLLADGLHGPSGEGDVRIGPDPDNPEYLALALTSPTGRAEFRVPARALAVFLADTEALCPRGSEVIPHSAFADFLGECLNEWREAS